MKISPEDLDGSFDLIVNAGISIATKESTIMATQTLLTALMQANAGGYMVLRQKIFTICLKSGLKVSVLKTMVIILLTLTLHNNVW